ncbi:MAG: hypothetical protein ACRBBN_11485 [Methyloligellaceae bacterium]
MKQYIRVLLSKLGLVYIRPETRLTDEEAIAIVRCDEENMSFSDMPLYVSDISEEAAGTFIYVSTATKGSGILYKVDDATGDIVDCVRWGVR